MSVQQSNGGYKASISAFFMVLALSGWAGAACAATYYVDADQGNDGFNGLSASLDRASASGPWRSLAKVAAAALMPGDQVLLRCGQSWRESLILMRGGASGSPITIGSNPSSCSNKPTIDGGLTIPADAWQPYKGNIYKAQLPFSVLPSTPPRGAPLAWRVLSPKADASANLQQPCAADPNGSCTAITALTEGSSLASYAFALKAGQPYTIRVQLLAPQGRRYGAVLRSDTDRPAPLTSYMSGTGTGAWQELSLPFTPSASTLTARLDIDVPGGNSTTLVRLARVDHELPSDFDVIDAVAARGNLRTAHHPNIGYSPSSPTSPYLKAGVSGYVVKPDGQLGSDYVVTGSDLVLPSDASLSPGIDVWIRSQSWSLSHHKITSVAPNRLNITPTSPFPLAYPGWGYFLTGALWMLDSPGEWFYDRATKTAYVWMDDSSIPSGRVSLTSINRGVSIGSPDQGIFPSFINLNNLGIANVGTGVVLGAMKDIGLQSMDIRNIAGVGLSADGSHRMRLESSSINNTGSDALFGPSTTDAIITNNKINNSGVKVGVDAVPISLPRENYGALLLNARSTITGNTLSNIGYIGIHIGNNSLIADNVVENFGLVLNDGGGLYAASAQGGTIRNNLVLNGVGNRDGLPSVLTTLMMSIYLDDYANDYTIQDNTLAVADYGLTLHDASRNRIEGNIIYGARRSPLRLHESRAINPSGDISGNIIRSNQFVHTTTGPAILQQSTVSSIEDFATFDLNAYSTLRSPVISQESGPNGYSGSFSLSDWQAKGAATGRTLEPGGYVAAPLRRFARGLLDNNLVAPSQIAEWGSAGGGNPKPNVTVSSSCGPSSEACAVFDAGGTQAAMTGPRFPVIKGNTYRVTFDGWVSNSEQVLSASVLRAGPPYESLMGLEPFVLAASSTWKRYSFTFVATADASSARMDFNDIAAGRQVRVANFEVVPFSSSGFDSTTTLLTNRSGSPASFQCPVLATQPAVCGKYFSFLTGQSITWPVTLNGRSSLVLFSQDDSLPDSDGDGVADSQDACPGTSSSLTVNARGCALNQ